MRKNLFCLMPRIRHSPKLSDAALELIAARFRALSEPTRLKLLMALEDGEKNVTELVNLTGATQTNVSRQLSVLATAGLLARRKSGLSVLYRIADPGIFDLCGHVCKSLQKRITQESEIFEAQAT
jgi:DNA-binding transcriptional ArsR family regulator